MGTEQTERRGLTVYDEMQAELQKKFPGWQIWYVPKLDKSVAWCARPWPVINSDSPEQLEADIAQAHTEASSEWPALASISDYSHHAPGIDRAL
ncbi:MAG: hypothetical protein JO345_24020 [Streptosporangiaceae bacterium]|nr:hypothetical protein [Streptosporangiaceae bacterium]